VQRGGTKTLDWDPGVRTGHSSTAAQDPRSQGVAAAVRHTKKDGG